MGTLVLALPACSDADGMEATANGPDQGGEGGGGDGTEREVPPLGPLLSAMARTVAVDPAPARGPRRPGCLLLYAARTKPQELSEPERLAFLINAYNA